MKLSLNLALLLKLALANAVAAGPKGYGGRTIYVQAPASISEAIAGASRGDRIVVGPGQYAEQVLVRKSGIQLIGQKGALIVPPGEPTTNDCSGRAGPGTQAGICIAGEGIVGNGFIVEHEKIASVAQPVEGVSVSGFDVSGFSGPNIFVLGGKNARVFDNELHNSPTYGFLTAGSTGTRVYNNVITGLNVPPFSFVGICMDDFGNVEAAENTISGHLVGLCISTSKAMVRNNDVSQCCAAAFADPGVRAPKIVGNHLHNSSACGPFGSIGLVIDGAMDSEVLDNKITDIHNEGFFAAGVSIIDDPCEGDFVGLACITLGRKAISTNNRVIHNFFDQNDLDINVDTDGAGNKVKNNECSTFQPTTLNPSPCR